MERPVPQQGEVESIAEKIPENDPNLHIRKDYLLNDRDILWYAPLGRNPVLAVHQSLIPDIASLIPALHTHPRVAASWVLLRGSFHWSPMARHVPQCVVWCGYRRRKRATSEKLAMFPVRAAQPQDVFGIDLVSLGLQSLAKNENLLVVVDKASRFPFASSLPS